MLFLFRSKRAILSLIVVILCVVFKDNLQLLFKKYSSNNPNKIKIINNKSVFSKEILSKYNGENEVKLYVALLGTIYDVTEGKKHYGKGSSYNYFVGKDGSRAFITGDFKDESDSKDHTVDLSCDHLLNLVNWVKTYKDKYVTVGVLEGRYFDMDGEKTDYAEMFENKIDHCLREKELKIQEDNKYPPCNMAWSVDEGTKVWCSKISGGVSRSWVGVPRQLYTPGEDKPRCVCINLNKDYPDALLKLYDNCSNNSVTCFLGNV